MLVSGLLGGWLCRLFNGYQFPKCLGGKKLKRVFAFDVPDLIGMILFGAIARNVMGHFGFEDYYEKDAKQMRDIFTGTVFVLAGLNLTIYVKLS